MIPVDINEYLIPDDVSVSEAIKQIDNGHKKVVFCTNSGRLSGCFTDGDMRRFILKDGDLHKPVSKAMNPEPLFLSLLQEADAKDLMLRKALIALPIVNERKEVVKIIFRDSFDNKNLQRQLPEEMPLVIMAGGKGTRLYPYTRVLPKALIPIGDVPIMDHIITRFGDNGIRDIYMVLNHKKGMIKAYYNDASVYNDINYRYHYVEEQKFQGTGGGLSLLKGKINRTFFLSNCDCLLDADYVCMYDFHRQHDNAMTVILATKSFSIPYGVYDLAKDGTITDMKEKPEYNFLINTGIYIIEPFVIDLIGENEVISMPDIAKRLIEKGYPVRGYPITEKSWLDMGQINEMQKNRQC